jgi:hypothetical protein
MLFKKNKTETFVNMYFGKLVSWEYNFIILGPTDQKLWEKFGQGEQVVKPTSKNWPHQPKKVGNKKKEVWEKLFESFLSSFLNLAPTLGRVKSSIPHANKRFY